MHTWSRLTTRRRSLHPHIHALAEGFAALALGVLAYVTLCLWFLL